MELQHHIDEFDAAGVKVLAVSYDPVGALAQFADERGITYPLLYDEGSELIKSHGILNTLVQPDEAVYGIPFPGSYVLDEDGVVVEKFFHREYQVREAASMVLRAGFGLPVDLKDNPRAEGGEPNVKVSAQLGTPDLKFRQRVDLYVRIKLAEGLHVNAPPAPEGFIPTEVSVTGPEGLRIGEPRYPQAEPFRIEGLDEEFNVFTGDVEVCVELNSSLREVETVPIDVEVRYQACDDHECFIPQTARLHLDVPLGTLTRPQRRD